ncbi:DegT/DnrJ/EryC1/StrS family aminotransferase [Streptomyces sp. NPDC059697]|uniref:DegT/DnrJ/EryC1/StrS family aminotransferase n=1 Tax=Streptomyces sp. NPDC059697 TaxID=3346912 RepID=UPI0036BB09CE
MSVPLHGTAQRYAPLADDIVEAVEEIAGSDEFILKSRVAALETELASRLGAAHAVACANTTGGLLLALRALGIGPGDEVLVPAWAEWSAISAVVSAEARPVLVDVEEDDGALDAPLAEAALSPATRAMLTIAPGKPLLDLADRHEIPVIELLGIRGEVRVSPAADKVTRVLALRPEGVLGGIGDAAVILTDDSHMSDLCRTLRNHGQDLQTRFLYHHIGYNSRMDELCAAFLLRRLPELDLLLKEQASLAGSYVDRLGPLEDVRIVSDGRTAAADGFLIRTAQRDGLQRHLSARSVETAHPRPLALHRDQAVRRLAVVTGEYPAAERLADEALVLPLYPGLSKESVDQVADAVAEFGAVR